MVLLLLAFAVAALGQSCPTGSAGDLAPIEEIRSSILSTSGFGATRLKPEWLVAPTTVTLCDYPGIICTGSCRVQRIDMSEWHIVPDETAPWEVRAGTTSLGALSFGLMTSLTSLTLTVPDGSFGVLPGTIFDFPVCIIADLPSSLIVYRIQGWNSANFPFEPNLSFLSSIPDGSSFFRTVLHDQTCTPLLQVFEMSGFSNFQGVYTIDGCITTPIVAMQDIPEIAGFHLCGEDVESVYLVNAGLYDIDMCSQSLIEIRHLVVANNPNLQIDPVCLLEYCEFFADLVDGGGSLSDYDPRIQDGLMFFVAQNDVCYIGQPQSEDVQLSEQSGGLFEINQPAYGYEVTAGGVISDPDVRCYVERDRLDCVDCLTQQESFAIQENQFDQCGLCNGVDACVDCAGVPNGSSVYDLCDVCDGDSTTCNDCNGVPAGTSVYDFCDVCNGDGSSCFDCDGVLLGTSVRDQCGVCNGSNECVDCEGIPFGTSIIDICGVCGGTNACAPCDPGDQDSCGVCNGDGTSCLDCAGVTFGTATYDACDVCQGNNTSCEDCSGVPNGTKVRDVCDVCGGDGTSCLGCDGQIDGPVYDLCGICGGNNACLDCQGVANGLASYDECDVCDGDNSSCTDCRGVVNGGYYVNACAQCVPGPYVPNSPSTCLPGEVADEVTTTWWIVFGVITGILVCCLICLLVAYLRRRRRRSRDAARRPSTTTSGRKPSATTIMFVVLSLMAVGTEAVTVHSSSLLYRELCETTNIAMVLPGSCPTNSMAVSACDADASGFRSSSGQALFTCHSSSPEFIRNALLDLVPGLSGTISSAAWQTFRTAEILRIGGSLEIDPLDDDDVFTSFTQLSTLVLRNVQTDGPINLWSSLGTNAEKLAHLEITNMPNLVGRFDHENVLCSFPFIKKLIITGTQLQGNPRCDRFHFAWFNLAEFNVRGNKLTGRLPNFFPLPFLRIIQADNNLLGGAPPLPNELPPQVKQLSLSNNRFSGSLPGMWSSLESLETFSFDNNRLSGTIPVLFMDHLREFSVSFNDFTGTLPPAFAAIPLPNSYDLFLVNDNRLEENWPPFVANQFTGPCNFEHNAVCRPRPPHPYGLSDSIYTEFDVARCPYSFDDTNLCPSGTCGDRTCLGCDGIANSGLVTDECGLCGGNGNACRDCQGTLFGSVRVDPCGICGGDSSTCGDCAGVPAGTNQYDACGVCAGDGSSCADCLGVPRGPAVIDACGVCGGRNLTCSDCRGVVNGTSIHDECGICNGRGHCPPLHVNQLESDLSWISEGGAWFLLIFMFLLLTAVVVLCACATRLFWKKK